MNTKWYLSTLILILTLLGFSQQEKYVPNQEIIVQFDDDHVRLEVAQNAIAIVTKQLQTIGVDKIQVREAVDGSLKITYYSDVDIAAIEEIFSKEKDLELGYIFFDEEPNEFPSNRDSSSYKLNVCEIGNNSDTEPDMNGYIFELSPEYNRLFNPIVFCSFNEIDSRERNEIAETAYKLHKKIAAAIDNSSHNIPEVRAGPFA
jgi:hypothetical protein